MARASRLPQWWQRRSRAQDALSAEAAAAARAESVLSAARSGLPLAPAAHPEGYGCSCDRVGCPTPGRHPVSFAWHSQASTDPERVERWLLAQPEANFVVATGVTADVLDVPLEAGLAALERLEAAGVEAGPVAVDGSRMLFFTATRGTPQDEDEWWPCELDCHPETMAEHPGLRWHCRGSYVLLPPARLPSGGTVGWHPSGRYGPERPLPDALTLLEPLTDACAVYAGSRSEDDAPAAAWY
ncbi:bifunctional DNA primase/polymerase [Streptomyces polyrhachis]|uniref:Bifunctional DNA primase/polymerase n=1 Tax=Streptomyces polyrhachis TaxID=1282885 RepID=A0ABW2GKJ8_9ACTN